MEAGFADRFSAEWIDAWNQHDLERVLSHYADDFEMSSPYIVQIANEPSGRLRGKRAVGDYWTKALQLVPDLHFELLHVLDGVESIALCYRGVGNRLATEVFLFNEQRLVVRSFAHYEKQ